MYPMKDVVGCDKSWRAPKQAMTQEFPNGEIHPPLADTMIPNSLILRSWREVGELKYLSSRRKEINRDSLSSDERNGNSPNHFGGVVGLRHLDLIYRKTLWKERPQRVIVPYLKYILFGRSILSRFGHVKSGLNLGGPPSKAKKCVRSIVN